MAYIRKARARAMFAEGKPNAFVRYSTAKGGLEFVFTLLTKDDIPVSVVLTHSERDEIIAQWAKFEKEWEQGS